MLGSIVAPASHYGFMMVSDLYGVGSHMGHGPTDHQHHSHWIHLNDAGVSHFECEYADLFATFVAASPATASILDIEPYRQKHFEAPALALVTLQTSPFHQRGPPLFS